MQPGVIIGVPLRGIDRGRILNCLQNFEMLMICNTSRYKRQNINPFPINRNKMLQTRGILQNIKPFPLSDKSESRGFRITNDGDTP